jgi:RimJ/RimL family protein N-acetyltransferase
MKIHSHELGIINNKLKLMGDNKVPDNFITKLGENFEWIWLPSSDVKQFLVMRNAEHLLLNFRNNLPITMEMHLNYLQKYELLQRIDFVLLDKKNKQYVGVMNFSLTSHGFEIGKYIGNVEYLGRGIAYPMSMSFINFVKENFSGIPKIRCVTRMDNYKNINLNFKLGFRIIQLVEENYWLMEMK